MAKKNFAVEWEDEVEEPKDKPKKTCEGDFADLLNQTAIEDTREYQIGQKVEALIISLNTSGDVLVELDPQTTGVVERSQLLDENMELAYGEGDRLSLYVVASTAGDIQLSRSLKKSLQVMDDLVTAHANGVPILGKVAKENKAGFDVVIFGKIAFCPVSQMDIRFINDKTPYLGKEFEFLLTKADNAGRNIVVSRAKLLRANAAAKLAELESQSSENRVFEGIVTEIRDFGAFVDIGGIEGLLPARELGYARHTQVRDFLEVHEKVRVKVIDISEKDGKKRVTLSMKALEADPWEAFVKECKIGHPYSGKVTKLESFGAFVELVPGVEGLVHISEMSWEKRIMHPKEIVNAEDYVSVRLLSLDADSRKISLSLKQIEDDPWSGVAEKYPVGTKMQRQVTKLKSFGALVELEPGLLALLPMAIMKKAYGEGYRKHASPPKMIEVTVLTVDEEAKKISLSLAQYANDNDHFLSEAQEVKKKPAAKMSAPITGFGAILAKKLEQQANKKK